jgi:hypothetical protein
MSVINAADLKAKMLALKQKVESRGVDEKSVAPVTPAAKQAALTEENNTHLQVVNRIMELRTALEEMHPQMPYLLVEIHKTLREYPDTVHLLTDVERSVIVQACFKHSGVVIVAANRRAGKSADGTKKLSQVSVDDI